MSVSSMVLIMITILLSSGVASGAYARSLRVMEGPTVLHAKIADQWGGHTFCYLLLGKHDVFWSATAHRSDGQLRTAIVGQHPKHGSPSVPAISVVRFDEPNVKGINQPQMIRSPDGYLHVFIGVTYTTGNPDYNVSKLRYFRSKSPDDVSELVDRTELIPTVPYSDFHLRMNVGISPDGQRMVLVILAISEDGSVPFNTPIIFIGEKKQASDFIFQEPIKYAEPMGFFYPQVAAAGDGIVVVGELWDNPDRSITRLLHLNWKGELMHQEDLPTDGDGTYLSYDLRPPDPEDWSRLILYYNKTPKERKICHHEFWEYNTQTRQLRLLRSLETEYGLSNAGKWMPLSEQSSVFINNPSMGQLHVWEGDILGGGEVTRAPLPGANPLALGFMASAYLFTPNPLQGSVVVPGEIYLASDCFNPGRTPEKPGSCSFLLWRLGIQK